MKIVIEIPDRIYKIIQNRTLNIMDDEILENALRNGKPLPEHHGDLLDRNEIKRMIEEAKVKSEHSKTFAENIIRFTPTIIEADKGVLEKINEKQDSLRATCNAWDGAIEKDGYVN